MKMKTGLIGLIGMAGKRVEIISHFTDNIDKLFLALTSTNILNTCNFNNSINLAHIYLKNTLGGTKKKMILFVGSPFECDYNETIQLGKKLRESGIIIEVYSFGNIDTNHNILKLLVDTVFYESFLIEIYQNEDFVTKFNNSINGFYYPVNCPEGVMIKKLEKYEKELTKNLSLLNINENIDIDM